MSAGDRRFTVTCKFCGRVVFTVAERADPEVAILVAHLARCAQRLRVEAALGWVLQRVRVAQVAGSAAHQG